MSSTSEDAISLYFQLKEGKKADLEVVAQAAIEWISALRAVAYEIDPQTNFRVELIDATEGSLSLNTVFEFLEEHLAKFDDGLGKYRRLRKLAFSLAVFAIFTGYPTYDFYFGDDATELSEEDLKRIGEMIEQTKNKPEVESKKQEFFRSLEKDPSIKGIGITEKRGRVPAMIIPSTEFPERSGLWQIYTDEKPETRTTHQVVKVQLIAPALINSARSWKFQAAGMPEFSAVMKDKAFLTALENDNLREHLRIGIPMTLRLKIEEKKQGGIWITKRRTVIEVITPKPG